jgi:hypothetical protein
MSKINELICLKKIVKFEVLMSHVKGTVVPELN